MLRAYTEHAVRAHVAETIASVKPVQAEVGQAIEQLERPPVQRTEVPLSPAAWAHVLDELSLNPSTGRLRLSLGPAVPELWGKTLLLAPALDVFHRVRWFCIPIDIPERYLPKECRGG